jgi:hypothetical protein
MIEPLDEWLTRHYRHDRLGGRGEEYEAIVRKSHRDNLDRDGYTLISHHESVTGEAVWYPRKPQYFLRVKQPALPGLE